MAFLVVQVPGAAAASISLLKPLTTIGSGAECDVRLGDIRGVVALELDGSRYMASALEGAPLLVNGKKRDRAYLEDGDMLQLGRNRVLFQRGDRVAPAAEPKGASAGPEAAALAVLRLSEFTAALAQEPGIDKALSRLLPVLAKWDDVTEDLLKKRADVQRRLATAETVKDARAIVGVEALLGVSTHSLAQARQAVSDGAKRWVSVIQPCITLFGQTTSAR